MSSIKSNLARFIATEYVSAARAFEGRLIGERYAVTVTLSSPELDQGMVFNRNYFKTIVEEFNEQLINNILKPAEPTLENMARYIGQQILDYLFKLEMDKTVRLESVSVREGQDATAVYLYEYEEEKERAG